MGAASPFFGQREGKRYREMKKGHGKKRRRCLGCAGHGTIPAGGSPAADSFRQVQRSAGCIYSTVKSVHSTLSYSMTSSDFCMPSFS